METEAKWLILGLFIDEARSRLFNTRLLETAR
jgi:hypothetical protein